MMLDNVNQLEKQLTTEEFHVNESKAIFRELKKQYLRFKYSWFPSNYERGVVHDYFLDYTQIEAQTFKDMLIQHLDSIEETINERVLHSREDMVNVKKVQIQEFCLMYQLLH